MKSFLATVLCVASFSCASQPYLGGSVGYAAGLPLTSLGTDYNTSSSGTTSRTGIYGSPGGCAIVPSLHGGVLSESGFGAELGVDYLLGLEQSMGTLKSGTLIMTYTGKASGVLFTPSLVVISKGTISPYARVGLLIGVGMNFESSTKTTHTNTTIGDTTYSTAYSGGIAFGFAGAAGAELALSKILGLFGELDARNLTWGPGQVKSDSTYTYKSSYSSTESNSRLQTYIPMQSLIFKIGLNLYL